jgi:hypothetical protein
MKEKRIIKKPIIDLFIFEFDKIRIGLPIETHKQEIKDYLDGLDYDGSWFVYIHGNRFILLKSCKKIFKCFEIFNFRTGGDHKLVNFKTQKEAFKYIEKTTKINKMKQRLYNLLSRKIEFYLVWDHEKWQRFYLWKL